MGIKKQTTKKSTGKKNKSRVRSMTGFGKGSVKTPYGTVTTEIKTLNHKSLSINCLPFDGFFLMEERLKGIFGNNIVRGKAVVRVVLDSTGRKESLKKVRINESIVREYVAATKKIQKQVAVKGEIKISDVLSFPGVIEQTSAKKEEKIWPYIKKAAEAALRDLVKYRETEGAALSKELVLHLKNIAASLKDVRKYDKQSIKEYRIKLSQTKKKGEGKKKTDKLKLEEEVALFARNCDVTEEICRLTNHIEAYRNVLKTAKGDVGKKLDFIAQEMHRETNTIGSKAGDYRVSNAVIAIKSEIEKIREQGKNIE